MLSQFVDNQQDDEVNYNAYLIASVVERRKIKHCIHHVY